jgi:hypothetical protein
LTTASCEALFGGFAADNPDNCVHNPDRCSAPDQLCNPATMLCEPALIFSAVEPPGGSNVGGTTLTLTGQRFVAGMTVTIDGVPATSVTLTSSEQLTVVTPPRPGRQGPVAIELVQPITNQHVQQDKLFRYYAEVSFQQQCFRGVAGVKQIVGVDLNGDGKTDLLTSGSSILRTHLSTGDGQTFGSSFDVSIGVTLQRLVAADVNGDGKPDAVFPLSLALSNVAVGLGNGDGTLQPLLQSPTPTAAYGLAVADIDGDRRLDALSLQNKDLVVQLGSGDGTFQAAQSFPYAGLDASGSSFLALADLDGDQRLDAVALNLTDLNVNVLYGQASGWSAPTSMVLSGNPYLALVSDYNQDGVLDLAIGFDLTRSKIDLFQGLGGRQLGALPTLMLPSNSKMAAQGDFNGDGLADLVTINSGGLTDNVRVYLGYGKAKFVSLAPLTVPTWVANAAVGDWDGDGHQDLVTVSITGDSICVLRTTVK